MLFKSQFCCIGDISENRKKKIELALVYNPYGNFERKIKGKSLILVFILFLWIIHRFRFKFVNKSADYAW